MNVFVLSTGRCGSTTFARACRHVTNYTSAHESKAFNRNPRSPNIPYASLRFPENHIEVDNRLSWVLGTLEKEYRDNAFYVHLLRDREEVARSFVRRWDNRGTNIILSYAWGPLTFPLQRARSLSDSRRLEVARHYWDTVNDNIRLFLAGKPQQITMWLHDIDGPFRSFWERVGAEGDLAAALAEWRIPHNASEASPEKLWRHKLETTARDLARVAPEGSRVLIVDENQWPVDFGELVAFRVERETSFPPARAEEALDTLRRRSAEGVEFLAFAWPSFWWFDHFDGFEQYLDSHARRILSNDRVVAYDIRGFAQSAE